MNQDPKQIVLKVLEIIDYQNDKDGYATKLIDMFAQKAFFIVIDSLTAEQQTTIKEQLGDNPSQEKQQEVFKQYISEDVYAKALQEATQSVFTDYITTILPTLTDEQQQNLETYLTSLHPQAVSV